MCAALTGGSHQVPKAGRASIEGRGIHLHRLLVATTLHGCKEQRFLPLFSKTVSFSLEKENHQKKKERGGWGGGNSYSLSKHSGSLVYAQPTNHNQSLMEIWEHSCLTKESAVSGRKSWTLLSRGKSSPSFLSKFSQTMLPPTNLKVGAGRVRK